MVPRGSEQRQRGIEASLKAQLKDVEGRLNNLLEAIGSGITGSTTAERMNVLENRKSMLTDALLAEQNRKKYDLTLKDIVKFLDSFIGDANDPDTRRRLLEFFVDKIYVYPDKLAITFYFSDDRRELPFEEMETFIDNRQNILDMMGSEGDRDAIPIGMRVLPSEDESEEGNPDFSVRCSYTGDYSPPRKTPVVLVTTGVLSFSGLVCNVQPRSDFAAKNEVILVLRGYFSGYFRHRFSPRRMRRL